MVGYATMPPIQVNLQLRFLDHVVGFQCEDDDITALLAANFEGLLTCDQDCDVCYTVQGTGAGPFQLERSDTGWKTTAARSGDLIYELEGNLVVWLQLASPGYAFLHAAALIRNEAIHLLTGHSGAGKSTTSFGLTHFGFQLLTDEMVAIDLATDTLMAFRHAVCLKQAPPPGFELPDGTMTSTRGYHIPPSALNDQKPPDGLPIKTIIFMEYDPAAVLPELKKCETAEAMTRLYPNVLNALSHPGEGLKAAAAVVGKPDNYLMKTAELRASCKLIARTVDSAGS